MPNDRTKDIRELEAKLEKLKKEQLMYDGLTEEQKLAEAIHDKMCKASHEDQCSWHYETWENNNNKTQYSKPAYLKKAKTILENMSYNNALIVLNNI
tara:strand:- start:1046 stop:1336 length:291 start_codon:yes stop_codon:yes gene_type:complete